MFREIVLQAASIERVQSHTPGFSTANTVPSPILSYSTHINQNVPLKSQDTLTLKQMNNAPKHNPCVLRIPTAVNTLPQYFQTPVTNSDNNTTYLTHNSTVMHDNIEEGFPVDHRNVGIHNATENQDCMNEAVSTVQQSGGSHHVSGSSVLPTESVEHVQRHIPEMRTANGVLSPLPLSSPQDNPNTPVHHSVAAGETITSVQHSSSMRNGPEHNLQLKLEAKLFPLMFLQAKVLIYILAFLY
jgi:hypothetical protein